MSVRGLLVGLLAGLCVLLLGAVPAGAATGYGDVCALLGSPGFCTAGAFAFPTGVAVDNSTNPSTKGDVYVVDLVRSRVLKFNAAGEPTNFEATGTPELNGSDTPTKSFSTPAYIAVDPVSGDIYVTNLGEPVIDKFNAKGEYAPLAPGAFLAPSFEGGTYFPVGVGVDPVNGDVYVSDRQDGGVVDVFDAEGALVRQFASGDGGSDSVAVNASGDVYVDNENASVNEFSASGTPLGTLDAASPQAVAVDPSDQNVFVGENGGSASYQIAEYGAPGTLGQAPLAVFGAGDFASNGSYGIAVNGSTHQVYASNAVGEAGLIFEEGPKPQGAPVAKPASEVTATTATLHGELNPEGSEVGFYFSYDKGASCTGPASTNTPLNNGEGPAKGAGPVEEAAPITGLEPSQHYTFCLFATNAFGRTEGSAESLTTTGAKPSVDGESALVVHSSGATLEAQVNPNNQETKYSFRYATNEALTGAITITGSTTLEGFGDQLATVTISGTLQASTTYYYRVTAENTTGATEGAIQSFTTGPPSAIDSGSAVDVTATSATLQAQINPLGADTTYYFQYGTTSCTASPASCTGIPAPPGLGIGSAETDQAASVHIEGVRSSTTYHYRVVATNTLGTVTGPDQTFTTQATGVPFALPDGRQYELVSPANKFGAEVLMIEGFVAGGVVQASGDGSKITYLTLEPPEPGAVANAAGNQLVSSRGSEGWSTRNVTLPVKSPFGGGAGNGSQYQAFSEDLSTGLAKAHTGIQLGVGQQSRLDLQAPEGYENDYLRDTGNGGVEALLRLPLTPTEPPDHFRLSFLAAVPNFKHVVVETEAGLTPGMPNEGGVNLYEWTAGKFEPINLLPNGTPTAAEHVGSGAGTNRPISNDGSRVVWTEGRALYVRKNIGTPRAETVLIEEGGPYFRIANGEVTKVFYGQGQRDNEDLFVFDVETGKSIFISQSVQGVVGVSEDGSYLYFVANNNLYLWHEGVTQFIATLSEDDERQRSTSSESLGVAADWSNELERRTARVSPDGKQVVFMSDRSLTGYDNTVAEGNSCGVDDLGHALPARCEEVFLYDAGTERLTCVSCNPTGGRPAGPSGITAGTPFQNARDVYQSRVLAADGGRVFFESADALVPGDTNSVADVYEWEQDGEGTCRRQTGCVSLISSGKDRTASSFLDASVDGSDVFFRTRDRLVNEDFDQSSDVYDAHVCSPQRPCFAAAPIAPPPCSSGDGCRPAPSPQPPVFDAPASATFSGQGNVTQSEVAPIVKAKKKPKPKKRKAKIRRRGKKVRHSTAGRRPSSKTGR